jgi:outer membrane protein OmpA-like peptidoglycan-associated protein
MPKKHYRGAASLLAGACITIGLLGAVGLNIRASLLRPLPVHYSNEVPEPEGEPLARIYFEISSAELPAEAGGPIQTVKEKSEASPHDIVLISGYHDPSGNPEQNAALAMQRALAAKAALVAAGVPLERIRVRKPEVIPGDADLQEARRVDIRVQ